MATAILMPQVGQDIETAQILEWHKQENEAVRKGDVVASVESDKATFDVEAYESGVLLKIVHQAGEEVAVLTPIAYIGQSGETPECSSAAAQRADQAASLSVGREEAGGSGGSLNVPASDRVSASPSARRVARERGIDLTTLVGSGPEGRITKADVLAAALSASPTDSTTPATEEKVLPFSPMRRRIAARLTQSQQTIPHFYLFADVDMGAALALRQQINTELEDRVTVTDMIVLAVTRTLSEHPRLNAHVDQDKTILKPSVNIGVAVSVTEGLAVPVIETCQSKDLRQISGESKRLVEAMRRGKQLTDAVGTFTVSNLGMHAIDKFLPIINPPECAILAVGQAADRPVVIQGQVAVRKMMTLTLACDHRAVDGTLAAAFLAALKRRLEDPRELGTAAS